MFDSYDLAVFGAFYNLNSALHGYTYTLALLVLTLEALEV